MDNFEPQAGGMHVTVGHEEDKFSVRGIVVFISLLVLSGILTFIAAGGLMHFFEWAEKKYFDKPATAAQNQLNETRGEMASRKGVRPQPDWYNREIDEKTLEKTFAAPRLQYDDAADMGTFRNAEDDRLNSMGKDPDGAVHIPISQAIDLLSQRGLPAVNGTFTAQPPLGGLEAVSQAAQKRLAEANAQTQQNSNRKK